MPRAVNCRPLVEIFAVLAIEPLLQGRLHVRIAAVEQSLADEAEHLVEFRPRCAGDNIRIVADGNSAKLALPLPPRAAMRLAK
jgi:hypothetical protein